MVFHLQELKMLLPIDVAYLPRIYPMAVGRNVITALGKWAEGF
jgi:hypothetical protein